MGSRGGLMPIFIGRTKYYNTWGYILNIAEVDNNPLWIWCMWIFKPFNHSYKLLQLYYSLVWYAKDIVLSYVNPILYDWYNFPVRRNCCYKHTSHPSNSNLTLIGLWANLNWVLETNSSVKSNSKIIYKLHAIANLFVGWLRGALICKFPLIQFSLTTNKFVGWFWLRMDATIIIFLFFLIMQECRTHAPTSSNQCHSFHPNPLMQITMSSIFTLKGRGLSIYDQIYNF